MGTFIALRCSKCDKKGMDEDNPKMTGEVRDKINEDRKWRSYVGWLCKCGHYNPLDK